MGLKAIMIWLNALYNYAFTVDSYKKLKKYIKGFCVESFKYGIIKASRVNG